MGLLTFLVAVFAVAFTTPDLKSKAPQTNYFYRFDGAVGEEDDMSKWTEVDAYGDVTCTTGTVRGCRITNTTNSGGHPTSVPLHSVTQLPIISLPTQPAVQNKNN